MDYKGLVVRRFPSVYSEDNKESLYWEGFEDAYMLEEEDPVSSIAFSPVEPYDYVICSSKRVSLYSPSTNEMKRLLLKDKNTLNCVSYRNDGKLLISGNDSGYINVFRPDQRSTVRSIQAHNGPVRSVRFCSNVVNCVSSSDDKTVGLWDIVGSKCVASFRDSADSVVSVVESESNPGVFACCSYDGCIYLWDSKIGRTIMKLEHESQVEDVVVLPGGSLLVSAGHNSVKVWDILCGGRLLKNMECHGRTIKSLVYDSLKGRILTGSMDQYIKVISPVNCVVEHSMLYPAPIVSVGLSKDNSSLVVGMSNNLVSIKNNSSLNKDGCGYDLSERRHVGKTETFQNDCNYIMRVDDAKNNILKPYDLHMKKFQYGKALDCVVDSDDYGTMVSFIEELLARNTMSAALSNRDEESLVPILKFISKNISKPNIELIIALFNSILDIYSSIVNGDSECGMLLAELSGKIKKEIEMQKHLFRIMGAMDLLFFASRSYQNTVKTQ